MKILTSMIVVAALVVSAGMVITGCGGEEENKAANTPAVDNTKVAGAPQTKCPAAMGGAINKDIYVDYQGKRIYMCCPGCEGTFNDDPEKYIKQMKDKGIALADAPAAAAADDDHEGHNH